MSENNDYETYECVPAGFNPLDAPPGDLDRYGIPQKPDPLAEPRLFAFWKKLVSPPFHPRPPSFKDSDSPFRTAPPSTLESSLNWSGAVVSPSRPKRFVLVVAGWTVPEVSRPSASALFTDSDHPKALIWVGLDGHNGRLPKISLPQIGTFHRPDGPADRQRFAWFYWWHHSAKPDAIKEILNFEIRPGHEIMAGLVVLISEDVLFFIKNQYTGEFRSVLGRRQPLGDIEPLGSSAEWVLERPTEPTSGKLYPLAAYRSVDPHAAYPAVHPYLDFNYCMALAADKPLAPGRLMTLADNGRILKIREAFADPYRTVYVSCAERRHHPDGSIGVRCTFHEPT
jgi:Peptidase A4 family